MKLLPYYFLALAPIITIFLLLVVARRSAKVTMPIAYLVTAIFALLMWRVSFAVVAASTFEGLVMAAEILYIVFGAILLSKSDQIDSSKSLSCKNHLLNRFPVQPFHS